MRRRRTQDVRRWLEQQPSLQDMTKEFPVEWKAVQLELAAVLAERDFDKMRDYVQNVSAGTTKTATRNAQDQLSGEIRQHLALAAVRRMCIGASTGVTSGRIRFNLLNGWVAQRLLFKKDLERKPVSFALFRMIWPLLWQRKFLMVLVQPKGIYCFYSKPLLKRIAELVDGRPCVEIAAGDGTLSRFLADAGVAITATDNFSWTKTVAFTDAVTKEDATETLRSRRPEVVICSWPPAGNPFEREVFRTESVQLYIVIGSAHRFGTGDWVAYEEQQDFTMTQDSSLARFVVPPETDPAVYVFRRKVQA